MEIWLINGLWVIGGVLTLILIFFFVVTRGALIWRALAAGNAGDKAHVYPVYSNMGLIKLVDFQPVISAILLFQYRRLVSTIVAGIGRSDLRGKQLLITSCAFGNVIPRVAGAAFDAGAERVVIIDIIRNELEHAAGKLGAHAGRVDYIDDNATAMKQADASVDANVIFFLLHELPDPLKLLALDEAARVTAPGGKLYIAEFHRPRLVLLRLFSWVYFKVFEPYGLTLWQRHDPLRYLQQQGHWSCQRSTCCFGNYQVIIATKH